ncbi:MAG: hypothetical protein K1X71_07350 [Pirellulales bacterium]|nr:hypothetical protein [Pirellulales bacterium]
MKNVADIYALAPLQQFMLAHSLSGGNHELLIEQFHCAIHGPLQPVLLRDACALAIERHPALRTCFAWQGLKQPVQVVRERVALSWSPLDWQDESPDSQTHRRDELLAADRERGFDLAQAPLARFHLVQLGAERWWFLWTCHHLIADGWSLPLVLQDVLQGYESLRQNERPRLPEVGNLGHYLTWIAKQDTTEADRYWRMRLEHLGPAARIPMDQNRHETSSLSGHDLCEQGFSAQETNDWKQLAARERVGQNAIVQSAWALLLAHHSGLRDIVFGAAVSGRSAAAPRIESIVGPLMNNVPLRVAIDWNQPWRGLLRQLQSQQSEMHPFEYYSLDRIALAAGLPLGRRLFDSLVVYENLPLADVARLSIGGLEITELTGTTSSNYAITLVVQPGAELKLRLMYDRQRFTCSEAARLLGQITVLLRHMRGAPDARLADLALLDAAGERQMRQRFASTNTARVIDTGRRAAPIGLCGEIWEAASTESADAESIADPWNPAVRLCPTGMRGVLREDGTIEPRGSMAAETVIDGYGVEPRDMTAELLQHPLVADAAVVSRVDQQGDAQLAAFVVPSADATTAIVSGRHELLLDQLRRTLAEHWSEPCVPRIWRALDVLPRDGRGQVMEHRLPAAYRPRGDASTAYVAPDDYLEARLCAIWSDLLGVQPVGKDDDFLDLGGNSGLAVALAARLEEEFGRRLPLALLFERPTVSLLANSLRRPLIAPEDAVLVPIRPTGRQTPLYCVHPAGGAVFCYLELARYLDADIPLYGLQALGIDGQSAPHDSIAAMAECYARAIQGVRPSGPYRICGWSTGGIIAFELSRQLVEDGHDVEFTALFDAAIPRSGEEFGEDDLLALLGLLFPNERPDQFQTLKERGLEAQLADFQLRAQRAQLLLSGATTAQTRRIYDVFQTNMNAVVGYRPQPLHRRLTLLRASQPATPMHADPLLGWGPWAAGGVDLHQVACAHLDMFREPAVREVADILNQLLVAPPMQSAPDIG